MRDGGSWISLIKQNVSPDHRIKAPRRVEPKEIGLDEFNLCVAVLQSRSLASLLNHDGVAIDARNMARTSNQLGGEQRDVAHPATQIEDPHAGLEAG
jgi:hypothetical protein